VFVFRGQSTHALAADAAMCESGAHTTHGPGPFPAFALPGAHAPHVPALPANPGTQKQSARPTAKASDELDAGHATLLSSPGQKRPGAHGRHAWSLSRCCVLKKPGRHKQSASEREIVGQKNCVSRKQ